MVVIYFKVFVELVDNAWRKSSSKKNEYLHLLIPIFYRAIADKCIKPDERWKGGDII